ncbi:MAG: hypothetical protein RL556_832 [Actinomycetota bacterium]|jgi:ADP-ribose pyrophosphatase
MPKDQKAEFSVTESELVFKGKIWNVVRERFDFKGTELAREFVQHTGAVAILAMDDEGRILLLRQYRHPVREYLWELPAGLLDIEGESRQDAAKRELLEESGYQANSWNELTEFYCTPGGNDELITIFLAKDLVHIGFAEELEGEEADLLVEWVPFSEALQSVLKSEMRNPSAVVGIMALALKQDLK